MKDYKTVYADVIRALCAENSDTRYKVAKDIIVNTYASENDDIPAVVFRGENYICSRVIRWYEHVIFVSNTVLELLAQEARNNYDSDSSIYKFVQTHFLVGDDSAELYLDYLHETNQYETLKKIILRVKNLNTKYKYVKNIERGDIIPVVTALLQKYMKGMEGDE